MENLKTKILSHNKKAFNKPTFKKKDKNCNCRAEPCPLNKDNLTNKLVYKATTDNILNIYIWSKSTLFKRVHDN